MNTFLQCFYLNRFWIVQIPYFLPIEILFHIEYLMWIKVRVDLISID